MHYQTSTHVTDLNFPTPFFCVLLCCQVSNTEFLKTRSLDRVSIDEYFNAMKLHSIRPAALVMLCTKYCSLKVTLLQLN